MNGALNFVLVICIVAAIFCAIFAIEQIKEGDRGYAKMCFVFTIIFAGFIVLAIFQKYDLNSRQGTYTFKNGEYTVYIDGYITTYYIDTLRDKVYTSNFLMDSYTDWSVEEFNQILKDRGLIERR